MQSAGAGQEQCPAPVHAGSCDIGALLGTKGPGGPKGTRLDVSLWHVLAAGVGSPGYSVLGIASRPGKESLISLQHWGGHTGAPCPVLGFSVQERPWTWWRVQWRVRKVMKGREQLPCEGD